MAAETAYGDYAEIIALTRQAENVAAQDWLVVAPIATGLIVTAILVIIGHRQRLQTAIALSAFAAIAIFEAALFAHVWDVGVVVMTMSDWRPPFGIAFVVDILGASFGLAAALMALAVAVYGIGDSTRGERRFGYYPFALMLLTGVLGAFHTGDLFNLYVWFEVLLISSFGLIVLGGRPMQLDGALRYCILNFLATTIFLVATGLLYGSTGTLNMADIGAAMVVPPAGMPTATIAALFLLGFGMKAAAFPLNTWLPASYHTPPNAVAAIFAGLLTKVGVYALLRTVAVIYPSVPSGLLDVLVILGGLTALVGALGALAQADIRRLASYLVVSGIGLMLIGIGIGSEGAYEGAIAYAVHSMVTMTALFLLVGLMVRHGSRSLARAGGLYAAQPILAAAFLAVAFSTAGLPPFSGFWPKVALVQAALADGAWFATAAILVSGIVTTIALGRVFAFAFWRDRPAERADETEKARSHVMVAPALALSVLVVLLGLWPRFLFDGASRGAALLRDPVAYTRAVFPQRSTVLVPSQAQPVVEVVR